MCIMIGLRPALVWLGQPPEVLDALRGGYWLAMAALLVPFTLFYTLKSLFDAINAPWLGVAVAFGAVALNVPANWLLIYGVGDWPGFGLFGAALASLLSQTASFLVALVIWRRSKAMAPARLPASVTMTEMLRQLRAGGTIATGYLGEGGAFAVAGLMIGWFGAAALAANQIVNSVATVLYMVPLGISIAVSIRVGQALGAERAAQVKGIGIAALVLSTGWMGLVMAGIVLAAAPIATALSDDPAVIMLATTLFFIIAAMQIADGVQGTMLGAARGMTDNTVPVAATLCSYWLVALPMAYVLGVWGGWGPQGIWIGYGAGLALAACLVTWRFFWSAKRLTTPTSTPT
jgi:MATE family multidrug resistance protein